MKKLLSSSVLIVLLCLILLCSGCGKKPQYTLTIAVEGEGTTLPNPGKNTYEENTVVTLKATPAAGYYFDQWSGKDGKSVSDANTIVMNGNKSITAVFSKFTYPLTITVNPEGVGTVATELVTDTDKDYEHGQTVRLTATPTAAGYHFDSWGGDLTGSENPVELLMDSAKSITANFIEVKAEIAAQPASSTAGQPVNGSPAVRVLTKTDEIPIPNVAITVAEKSGQPFQGTKTVLTNGEGIAIFDDLIFYEGNYQLVFSSTNLSDIESNTFSVNVAGAGTAVNPYLIHNLHGLMFIETHLNDFFRVENDIDASVTRESSYNDGAGWLPIGQSGSGFAGQIDGNGKTISGLYINRPSSDCIGLIKEIKTDIRPIVIKNLHLTDVEIVGGNNVGGLVGQITNSTSQFENCSVTGEITGMSFVGGMFGAARGVITNCSTNVIVTAGVGSWYAGGLAGVASGATITKCFAFGSVAGNYDVGGLLGLVQGSCSISQCYASVDVNSLPAITNSSALGGFAGCIDTDSTVSDCFSRGEVSGHDNIAGFCGYLRDANIVRCYSTGAAIASSDNCGGFTAFSYGAFRITNCYYDRDTTGFTSAGNGEPLTTAQMQDSTSYNAWDFTTVWAISSTINDGYPYLRNTPIE